MILFYFIFFFEEGFIKRRVFACFTTRWRELTVSKLIVETDKKLQGVCKLFAKRKVDTYCKTFTPILN